MLRTRLCDLLDITVPIVVAPFGPWDETRLAVAACRAGALGSLGTALRGPAELRAQWERVREQTDRPFAVNHTGRPFDPEAFAATLDFAPAPISFHMGIPADLVARAHDAGIRWIQSVGDVPAAEAALAAGADVLVAQGTEAGGNAGWVSSLVLVPAVVDVAGTVPVVAAGGIADGRGLAAALVLGAQGVSLGTRFLATPEMAVDQEWKDRVVAAAATDAVKVPHAERVMPPFTLPQVGQPYAPRALRTELVSRLERAPETVDPARVGHEVRARVLAGGGHDLLPFAGQSVQLVHDVVPAGELISRLVAEAEALRAAQQAVVPAAGSRGRRYSVPGDLE
ncbi:NAD(P)H-dependent flavin oxidoreductase [Modestobacter marinus]|uniref:NAD(P)H-dependent flavin oxidoreductase n=1 Tax=Modestobacter marinus TaxID=477641 RepID=UPI001C9714D1|nr:nitronate monooxygenase [Modestobacter marinus]